MRNTLILFLMLFSLSCSSEEPMIDSKIKFVIVEKHLTQEFTKAKSNIVVPVETNLKPESWSVESSDAWCLVAKSGGNAINILVLENQEPEVRTTTIKVNSLVLSYDIKISQLGYGRAILLNNSEVKIKDNEQSILVRVTANVEYNTVISEKCNWIKPVLTRALVERELSFQISANPLYEERVDSIAFVDVKDPSVRKVCIVKQAAKDGKASDVVVDGDIQIKPTGGVDSEHQPGNDITKCFDGIMGQSGGVYHSIWNQSANFPVKLEFFFDGQDDIDYFIYHTRSGNGNFGALKVYTMTTGQSEYVLQGSYDFKQQNAASKVSFNAPVRATKIKFEIYSGAGNFVSCDEMQFFKSNSEKNIDKQLLTVFTDITCSNLKPGVTKEQINLLPPYFAKFATSKFNDTYNSEFRVDSYQPYSDVEIWAERLMTKRYSNLDNPTGICVNANDTIIVLVGDTYGNQIALQNVSGIDVGGDNYFLSTGVNKLVMRKAGMLFIMYTANLSSPTAKPIKIHIPMGSGVVNGYFDLKRHKTNEKYAELLRNASYKYFIVKGDRIMFNFHLSKMRDVVPTAILPSINLWDNLIAWQQELMGIDDVRPTQVNNHLMAVSPEDSYMWASDYQIGFVYTYLENILLPDRVMAAKDNVWGPAHEIGHIHQRTINWPSSTESSNNLFSNYSLYKLGKYCSRGSELSQLAQIRCILNSPWYDFGDAHQGENTEMHMRMNWQLWNYYHRCGYKTNFWQTLFKLLRDDRIVETNPGEGQLKFATLACKAANENLTEFFEMWGFFVPVNTTIDQYGTYKYVVTQDMIDAAKQEMSAYPNPNHAFYYLEDRKNGEVGIDNYKVGDVGHYSQFKNNVKITKEVSYIVAGSRVSVRNGDEAVAFEVKKADTLLYFSNFFSFDVPASVDLATSTLYAVQADGRRVQMLNK